MSNDKQLRNKFRDEYPALFWFMSAFCFVFGHDWNICWRCHRCGR